jgi:hypothetical protein
MDPSANEVYPAFQMFDLDHLAQQLRERSVRRTARVALGLKGGLIVCSSLAAVSHFTGWPYVGVAVAVLAAVFGCTLVWLDRDSSDELWEAETAVAAARRRQSELDDRERGLDALESERLSTFDEYDNATVRYSSLYTAMDGIRALILQAPRPARIDSEAAVLEVMEVHGHLLAISAGFRMEDRWTISIYRADPAPSGKRDLRLIAHYRSSPCDLKGARVFPEGIGVVGVAYQRGADQIVPDITNPVANRVYGLGRFRARG